MLLSYLALLLLFAYTIDCNLLLVSAAITSASFSHDGQSILVGSSDSTVRLLDKSTGEMLAEYVLLFLNFTTFTAAFISFHLSVDFFLIADASLTIYFSGTTATEPKT